MTDHETGIEVVRKHVTFSGLENDYVTRYNPEQAKEIIAWREQLKHNCEGSTYLAELFDKVYDKTHASVEARGPNRGRQGDKIQYTLSLTPYEFWCGTDHNQGTHCRWCLGGIQGEPEVWYGAVEVTLIPLWERIKWYKNDILSELVRGIDKYAGNPLLTSRRIVEFRPMKLNIITLDNRFIEQRILGGVLIGLELINPTHNPALLFKNSLKKQIWKRVIRRRPWEKNRKELIYTRAETMADQLNMTQITAGQLITDIKIHFQKNNVRTIAKEKIRRLDRIVPEWVKREWYPKAYEPIPSREQCKLLRQRTTDEMNEKRRLIGERCFLKPRRQARSRWEDDKIFRDELLGLMVRGVLAESKTQMQKQKEEREQEIQCDIQIDKGTGEHVKKGTLYPKLPEAVASAPPSYVFTEQNPITQAPMLLVPAQRLEIIDDGMEEVSTLVKIKSEQMDVRVDRLQGHIGGRDDG